MSTMSLRIKGYNSDEIELLITVHGSTGEPKHSGGFVISEHAYGEGGTFVDICR